MLSAFGVEHGGIAKAKADEPSTGRYLTSYVAPGIHGAVAGKKGHKLRAAGSEAAGFIGGGAAGMAAGTGVGMLTRNRHVASGVNAGLTAAGSMLGTYHAHRKGHYQPQKKKGA